MVDNSKDPHPNLIIRNLRGHDHLKQTSIEMIKVMDFMQKRGMQQQSYEAKARQEYLKNP